VARGTLPLQLDHSIIRRFVLCAADPEATGCGGVGHARLYRTRRTMPALTRSRFCWLP
jgi:hypothetical protein